MECLWECHKKRVLHGIVKSICTILTSYEYCQIDQAMRTRMKLTCIYDHELWKVCIYGIREPAHVSHRTMPHLQNPEKLGCFSIVFLSKKWVDQLVTCHQPARWNSSTMGSKSLDPKPWSMPGLGPWIHRRVSSEICSPICILGSCRLYFIYHTYIHTYWFDIMCILLYLISIDLSTDQIQ